VPASIMICCRVSGDASAMGLVASGLVPLSKPLIAIPVAAHRPLLDLASHLDFLEIRPMSDALSAIDG